MLDFILNGQGQGSVANALLDHDFDTDVLRPWRGEDGRNYILQNVFNPETRKREDKVICVQNTGITAALRKDDWVHLDAAIIKVAKPRLRFVSAVRGAGLNYVIPNGFGKTVLQHETQTDINEASITMNPEAETPNDRPVFDLTNLPLPIIHKDFSFNTRQLAASRNGGSPLDTTTAELASRRVSEAVEKLHLGTFSSGYKYGGGYVYGLTTFPSRMTKTLTSPASPGWTPDVLLDELLAMKEQSQLAYHYGPWMLFNSTSWDKYLDADYSAAKGDNTLRKRILMVDGFQGMQTLDYLPTGTICLVQMSSDIIRTVVGMEMTTVQWEPTPFKVNFKVLCILVPQYRADSNGNTGIVHGLVA